MARPLRIEYAGAVYHVTSRGNGYQAIFLTEEDYGTFLRVLGQTVQRMGWRCHAYCLMGNHYHLVVETPDAEGSLSRGMRHLNGVYTQAFNRGHKRVGHVLQGRYKAVVVDRDAYLKEVCRYVVLNPVRAGMVKEAEAWPWSSYGATAGTGSEAEWLTTEWLLGQFGETEGEARRAYCLFVADGVGREGIAGKVRQQIYLGDDEFVRRMQERVEPGRDLREIPDEQHRAPVKELEEYEAEGGTAGEAMAKAYLSGGYTQKEVAAYFGVHYSTVSRAVARYERREREHAAPRKT